MVAVGRPSGPFIWAHFTFWGAFLRELICPIETIENWSLRIGHGSCKDQRHDTTAIANHKFSMTNSQSKGRGY
jgi:hypothetical protein